MFYFLLLCEKILNRGILMFANNVGPFFFPKGPMKNVNGFVGIIYTNKPTRHSMYAKMTCRNGENVRNPFLVFKKSQFQ